MRHHHEIERTWSAPADAPADDTPTDTQVPDLVGTGPVAALGKRVEVELDAVYVDTVDLRLTRAGISLRRRTGGSDEGWHLKVPAGEGRDEVHRPLGRGTRPPKPLRDAVLAWTVGAELGPVAQIRTRRTTQELVAADGTVLAELADDTSTAVRDEAVVVVWREVEVELVDGTADLLDVVDERLREAGFEPSAVGRKIERALGDLLPAPERRPRSSRRRPAWRPVHARLVEQLEELRRCESEVRRRRPDAVHRTRVAARRLRSALRTFAPLLDGPGDVDVDGVQSELGRFVRALGGERDAEVAAERVDALLDVTPPELLVGPVRRRVRAEVASRMRQQRAATATELGSPQHLALLSDLDRLVADPPWSPLAARRARDVLPGLLASDARRVKKRFEAAAGSVADDDWHRARSAAKRLRYAAETLVPAYGKDAARVTKAAKRLQRPLGELQDTRLSRAMLLEVAAAAHAAGESSFGYGVLHAREEAAADRARDLAQDRWRRTRKRGGGKTLRLP